MDNNEKLHINSTYGKEAAETEFEKLSQIYQGNKMLRENLAAAYSELDRANGIIAGMAIALLILTVVAAFGWMI